MNQTKNLSLAPTSQSKSDLGISESPIFIFGCPRSGTSLLSRIIGCHPRIAIPFESHLYNTFYPWLKYYGNLQLIQNRERLVDDILTTEVMRDWSPPPNREHTLEAIYRFDFHGIVDGIMGAWTNAQGKQRWGEKTPAHIFYWREIFNAFPNLQVLHIVRDGRDVALSWKGSRFGPKHIYPLAQKWREYLETVEELRTALNDDSFLEVRYEELLLEPEGIVRKICTFLKEEFAPEMLEFHKVGASYPTDQKNQKNLSRPPLTSNAGKWRSEMTERELRIFEAVAGGTLERYGYERQWHQPQISGLEVMQFRFLEHPPRKILAMLKNTKGHIDGIRRLKIYCRLRLGI
ncbi:MULTISPECIES: sulfotransferase [Moorena]|uniref:Sulfotransferase domain protein n=1 Tax=Moorena producens 3L TaxID=489825 RepID=F4XMP7_9CYAN|nr:MULTISPECIES: sulfotransferase [Moorena]NEQ16478.1 sulfotransferase [Moorena sp. SIO3E2]EGJ33956.1 sulfotransferase domain protein [Moorena producens 3L]NEP34809.1 sulfotransferase [Moorena sp. SIO3B2]NEP65439.1 sulfotransferase [Moorena sp. SIO3A5]NEQ07881.1 sulfotransferase [Moorena sp. SIO4E2]